MVSIRQILKTRKNKTFVLVSFRAVPVPFRVVHLFRYFLRKVAIYLQDDNCLGTNRRDKLGADLQLLDYTLD